MITGLYLFGLWPVDLVILGALISGPWFGWIRRRLNPATLAFMVVDFVIGAIGFLTVVLPLMIAATGGLD